MATESLLKISEVMRRSGLPRQTVHEWTVLGLIRAEGRTASRHRLYDPRVVERLERIRALKATRSLREIRRVLEAEDGAGGARVAPAVRSSRRKEVARP